MVYCEAQAVSSMIITIFGLLIFFAIFGMICGVTKSRKYRKLLVDLYVAGKVRKMATKESIDLAKEFKDFRSVIKKWKMESQPLDDTIEQELQEKTEEDKSNSK